MHEKSLEGYPTIGGLKWYLSNKSNRIGVVEDIHRTGFLYMAYMSGANLLVKVMIETLGGRKGLVYAVL